MIFPRRLIYQPVAAPIKTNTILGGSWNPRVHDFGGQKVEIIDSGAKAGILTRSPLLEGLQSFWLLNEDTTGLRKDAVGQNHLTPSVSMANVAGLIPNTLALRDDAAGRCSIADNPSFDFLATTSWTLTGWFYINAFGGGFICGQAKNPIAGPGSTFHIENTGASVTNFVVYYTDLLAVTATDTKTLSTATWYFLALLWDNSALTVSGEINRETRFTSSAAPSSPINGTVAFAMGDRGDPSVTPFDGRIQQFGLWNRLLSNQELDEIYRGGAPLVGYPWFLV